MKSWRVIRKSTTTGRTLKVLAADLTLREAELFAEGFGRDESRQTVVVVEDAGAISEWRDITEWLLS